LLASGTNDFCDGIVVLVDGAIDGAGFCSGDVRMFSGVEGVVVDPGEGVVGEVAGAGGEFAADATGEGGDGDVGDGAPDDVTGFNGIDLLSNEV
jgi:hypothetical protein